jgi:hypothetical protein
MLPVAPDFSYVENCNEEENETWPTAEWMDCFQLVIFTVHLFNGKYVSVVGT